MAELSTFFGDEDNFQSNNLSHIFAEEPVGLDVFIKDSQFLDMPGGLSKIQYDFVKHAERIYRKDMYPLMGQEFGGYWKETEDTRMTNLMVAQYGKGAGKDLISRISLLRVVYLLLCMRSPQEYFGMPHADSIHALNMAKNAPQSRLAFFEPMTRIVKRGWFADKADPKKSSIMFDKGIEAISGHSSVEGLEGLNLLVGVADEIDAFPSRTETTGLGRRTREASTTAEAVLNMLRTSAATRFPEVYKQITISYPRYAGSVIQQVTAEGKADNVKYGRSSNFFVSGPYATWEVNPLRKKSDFDLDYQRDPVEAAAKYECSPAKSSNPYFRDISMFKDSIDRNSPAIKVSYELLDHVSEETGETTQIWEPVYEFAEWFRPVQGALYAMHGDLAIVGDRAGVAMSHVTDWEEKDVTFVNSDNIIETRTERLPKIRNDFTIAFESDIGANPAREIKVRWARELAFELIRRGFEVSRFTFDQFQSKDSMQILEEAGIETERVSTDMNNNVWRSLKDIVSDRRIKMEANDLLITELEALIDLGRKVDHAPTGSKDLADAFACSIVGAIELGGSEDEGYTEVTVGESIFNYGVNNPGLAMPDTFGVDLNNLLPTGMTMEALRGTN